MLHSFIHVNICGWRRRFKAAGVELQTAPIASRNIELEPILTKAKIQIHRKFISVYEL